MMPPVTLKVSPGNSDDHKQRLAAITSCVPSILGYGDESGALAAAAGNVIDPKNAHEVVLELH
jgi:hypothetical protein